MRKSLKPLLPGLAAGDYPERIARNPRLTCLLKERTKDGSLLSVRIPVTSNNRSLLREIRAAELAAWEDVGKPPPVEGPSPAADFRDT